MRTLLLLALVVVGSGRALAHVPDDCAPPPSGCPAAGSCLAVTSDLELSPSCAYQDVRLWVASSGTEADPLVIDCRGATLRGAANDDNLYGINIHSHESSGPVSHVVVRNCTIDGFTNGIAVWATPSASTRTELRFVYQWYMHHPIDRARRVEAIEDRIRASAPQHLRFHDVNVRRSYNVGVYLFPYVNHVTFEDGSVRDTHHGPGVYLDSGSRYNVIADSQLTGNEREGVAVDASAFNVIRGNVIRGNDRGGILLYRNCWEHSERQLPRPQHAGNNEIVRNTISDEKVGVWVAARQGKEMSGFGCGDPVYYSDGGDEYFRDDADHNRVEWNTFYDVETAVIVRDDDTVVRGNWIDDAVWGVFIGDAVRSAAGDPVHGTVVDGNVFSRVSKPVQQAHCAVGTSDEGNWTVSSGSYTPYSVASSACHVQRATFWGHLSSGGAFAYRSFFQTGARFGGNQHWIAGDFDGDGADDLVSAYGSPDGRTRVWLRRSTGTGFEYQSSWQTLRTSRANERWLAGDVNGDGLDDLIRIAADPDGRARVIAHYSTGEEFEYGSAASQTLAGFGTGQRWLIGDVNGDGLDDLINVYGNSAGQARVWTHHATGSGFEYQSSYRTLAGFSAAQKWLAADVNGDGLADLVNVYPDAAGTARVWTHLSTGAGFEYQSSLQSMAGFWDEQRWLAVDFDGDQADDLVNVYGASGTARAWRHRATGSGGFEYLTGLHSLAGFWSSQVWLAGDFDGDGRDDLLDVYGAAW